MGYWETYKKNYLVPRKRILLRRDQLIGTVVPILLIAYLWAIGEGVVQRPSGPLVEWWIHFISGTFSIVEKADSSLAGFGASKKMRDFSVLAFSLLVFGMFLNLIVQFFIGIFAKPDEQAAKALIDHLRKNIKLNPRAFLALTFIFLATMIYLLLVEIGFDPARLRKGSILGEFYFLSNFLTGLAMQYALGSSMIMAIVLRRLKLI